MTEKKQINIKQIKSSRRTILSWLEHAKIEDITAGENFQFLDEKKDKETRTFPVIFPAFFLLHALSFSKDIPESVAKLKKKLTDFLLAQSNGKFSWNYWVVGSENNQTFPLPDDIDDSAYSIAALTRVGVEIGPKYFMKMIGVEVNVGGPYRTWYVGKDAPEIWRDVDPVVNADLAYACALNGLYLKNMDGYLLDCLQSGSISSPYYPSDTTFLLFASRYCNVSESSQICKLLLVKIKECEKKDLQEIEKIQLILAKLYLHSEINATEIESILTLQEEGGYFPSYPICFDFRFAGSKSRSFTSSRFATSALVLEIWELILQREELPEPAKPKTDASELEVLISRHAKKVEKLYIMNGLKPLDTDISKSKPIRLAGFAVASLAKKELSAEQLKYLDYLVLALTFAWHGYTLMDDIVDGQRDNVEMLTAMKTLRISWQYTIKLAKAFPDYEIEIFVALAAAEEVYNWELLHKTESQTEQSKKTSDANIMENYAYIEKRMQGFLTTMKLIPRILYGKSISESELSGIADGLEDILKSIIIIEQLNDDAHDWEEDKIAGNMSYVLWKLDRIVQKGENPKKVFWNKLMPSIIADCYREYEKALAEINKLSLQNKPLMLVLEKAIAPIRKAEMEMAKMAEIIDYLR